MRAFAQVVGGGVFLLMFLLSYHWSLVVVTSIEHDLHEYGKLVRASKRTLDQKERLLNVIDSVEERLEQGAVPSMLRWVSHNDAIRAMIDHGITEDEVRLIERQLQKVEKELDDR